MSLVLKMGIIYCFCRCVCGVHVCVQNVFKLAELAEAVPIGGKDTSKIATTQGKANIALFQLKARRLQN